MHNPIRYATTPKGEPLTLCALPEEAYEALRPQDPDTGLPLNPPEGIYTELRIGDQRAGLAYVIGSGPEGRMEIQVAQVFQGRGVGTRAVAELTACAFESGRYAALTARAVPADDLATLHVFQKNGYTCVGAQDGESLDLTLTRADYLQFGRVTQAMTAYDRLPLSQLQPTAACLSQARMDLAESWFDPADPRCMDPLLVYKYQGQWLLIDGHIRAALAHTAGWDRVPVRPLRGQINHAALKQALTWCRQEGVLNVGDLVWQVCSLADYQQLWRKRCQRIGDIVSPENQ